MLHCRQPVVMNHPNPAASALHDLHAPYGQQGLRALQVPIASPAPMAGTHKHALEAQP